MLSPKAQEILNKIKNWFKKEPSLKGDNLDELEEEVVLKSLDPDFTELLKSYVRKDKENYFTARDERTRLIIRGEYLRTLFLLKKIERLRTPKAEAKETNIPISRYGV